MHMKLLLLISLYPYLSEQLCGLNEFQCKNGECILKKWVCDFDEDCHDGSDEGSTCKYPDCTQDQFKCSYGKCIPVSSRCDATSDCSDKSDEAGCDQCREGLFLCSNEKCIPEKFVCDFNNDCGDDSDEGSHCIYFECNHDEFQCSYGECIPASGRCDGRSDCLDDSDEYVCDQCREGEYLCSNGRCIPEEKVCDFNDDCTDGSDEGSQCKHPNCTKDEFKCSNGKCIQELIRCDGRSDCSDSFDEDGCDQCREDAFLCTNGRCIPEERVCNFDDDCGDGSDEGLHCKFPDCTQDEFECSNGNCIPISARCDGYSDCNDLSDEDGCDQCSEGAILCRDRTCIPEYLVCDFDDDGSDEGSHFKFPYCTQDEFECSNRNCIPISGRCDGHSDCNDLSDEDGCECRDDEFQCNDMSCIPEDRVCDLYPDCENGFDEGPECRYRTCTSYQMTCTNGTCIPKTFYCDGKDDCGDNSDEYDCDSVECDPGKHFECQENERYSRPKCIPRTWICDGQPDCVDGVDEENDSRGQCTLRPRLCEDREFQCNDGECIHKKYLCDTENQCSDGSDEGLHCNYTRCSADDFKCTDTRCVHESLRCDEYNDCGDHSDEMGCVCRRDQFVCNNTLCISRNLICDFNNDCVDGSDEGLHCNYPTCTDDDFSCSNGKCIPKSKQCNDEDDCGDSSDEMIGCGREARSSLNQWQILHGTKRQCTDLDKRDFMFSKWMSVLRTDMFNSETCFKAVYREIFLNLLYPISWSSDAMPYNIVGSGHPCVQLIMTAETEKRFRTLDGTYQYNLIITNPATQSLILNCSKSLSKLRTDNSADNNGIASQVSSLYNLLSEIFPLTPWFCTSLTSSAMYDIGLSLLSLFRSNRNLPKECAKLVCHKLEEWPGVEKFPVFIIDDSFDFDKCRAFATRKTTLMETEVFSFSEKTFSFSGRVLAVFVVNGNHSFSKKKLQSLALLHFVKNPNIKNCCLQSSYNKSEDISGDMYHFCHGPSQACHYSDNLLWESQEIVKSVFVISLLNELTYDIDLTNLFLRFLIRSNITVPVPLYQNILKLYPDNFMLINQTKNYFGYANLNQSDTETTERLISEFKMNCIRKVHFKRCNYGRSSWLFTYNCSLPPKSYKAMFFATYIESERDLDIENYCANNTFVAKIDVAKQNIALEKKGGSKGIWIQAHDHGIGEEAQSLQNFTDSFESVQKGKDDFFVVYPAFLSKTSAIRLILEESQYSFKILTALQFLEFKENNISQNINKGGETETDTAHNQISIKETIRMLMKAIITNNTQCQEDFAKDRFTVNVDISDDLQYLMGPIPKDITNTSCLSILPDNIHANLQRSNDTYGLTVNKFWPTCYYNFLVSWRPNADATTVKDWDYLPYNCKITETLLFILMIIITTVTIIGNVLTLAVLIFSGLVKKEAFLILTNLAFADLLLALTSAVLAVHDTNCLRENGLTIYDLDEDGTFANFEDLTSNQAKGFQQLRFERKGWPAVCSIAMNISVFVSLMLITLLSISRLRMLNSKNIGSKSLKVAIGIIWAVGILVSTTINYRKEGWLFVGYFDPITKLTINIGTGSGTSASTTSMYVQIIIGLVAGVVALTTMVTSVIVHYYREKRELASMAIHQQNREKQWRDVSKNILLMVGFLMVSTFSVLLDLSADFASKYPLCHFFLWWIFMAGASWNWVIYCFRGRFFRQEAMKFFSHIYERV